MKRRNLQNAVYWLAGMYGFVLSFSSCTAEMTDERHMPDGTPVTIRAEIDTTGLATRAADPSNEYDRQSFVTDDRIRVTSTTAGSTKSVFYKLNNSSQWEAQGNDPLRLQVGTTYQAEYPFDYSEIRADQSNADNYRASNYLKTKAVTSKDGVLRFTGDNAFAHQNTKITLSFKGKGAALSTSVSDFTNFTISATGLRTGGGNTEEITFYRPGASLFDWCGIVYPQGADVNISLSLTYANVAYKTTITCPMAAGTHYKYTLTLANDLLVPTGTEIKSWASETVYTGDFDQSI